MGIYLKSYWGHVGMNENGDYYLIKALGFGVRRSCELILSYCLAVFRAT